MPKCEFCDINLKTDLDVSKHLTNGVHRDNVRKATSLRPTNKSDLKDTPNSIVKVFEALKLRTPKDVRDLAYKGYFKIPENNQGLLSVADQLVHVFLKCIAEHRTRNLAPETRKIVMDSFDVVVKKEPAATKPPSPQPQAERSGQQKSTHQNEPRPIVRPQQTGPYSKATREPTPAGSPPLKRRPPNESRPAPVCNPSVFTHPSSHNQPVSSLVRNSSTIPSSSSEGTDRQRPPNNRLTGANTNSTSTNSNGSRIPNQASTRPVMAPHGAAITPAPTRQPAHTAAYRQAAPRAPRPPAPRLVAPRTTDAFANRVATPRPALPNTNMRPVRPPSDIPPPHQMPMAGASFMPRRPIDDEPPRPRLDSNYQPRLAKIKVEPKDTD